MLWVTVVYIDKGFWYGIYLFLVSSENLGHEVVQGGLQQNDNKICMHAFTVLCLQVTYPGFLRSAFASEHHISNIQGNSKLAEAQKQGITLEICLPQTFGIVMRRWTIM